jgi:hypothetical protein
VVLAVTAFRCANTPAAFVVLEVPSGVVVVLPTLFFLEVSADSEPTFPAGNIFFPAVGGTGRGKYETFISSKTWLTRP